MKDNLKSELESQIKEFNEKSEANNNLQRTIVSTAFEEIADRFPRRRPKTKSELQANQTFNASQMQAKVDKHKSEK